MKTTMDPEIFYGLGIKEPSRRFTLLEKKDIFQDAMTNFCDGYCLEDIINLIPMKIRNEELEKGLIRVREKSPHCLGWHFAITEFFTEPQRSKEMLRIYKESVPYGDQAGYSALYHRLKFINQVLEPDRTDELEKLLSNLVREYCLHIDYWEADPDWDGLFPKSDCEKIINIMADNKRSEKIKKIANDFLDKDFLNEAEKFTGFLFGQDKDDVLLKIEAKRPFVKRYQLHYVARMIGN